MSGTKNSSVSCNKIAVRQADTNQVGKHFFQSKKEVKENDVTEMLQKMYTHELQNYNTNSAGKMMEYHQKI